MVRAKLQKLMSTDFCEPHHVDEKDEVDDGDDDADQATMVAMATILMTIAIEEVCP